MKVIPKPDGRKCNTCVRRDDEWDPFTLQVFGKKVYMWWSKPVNEQGETCSCHCGYCAKFFLSQIKKVMKISIGQYEILLGQNGGARLKVHMAVVDASIELMVQKRSRSCSIGMECRSRLWSTSRGSSLPSSSRGSLSTPATWIMRKTMGRLRQMESKNLHGIIRGQSLEDKKA